MRISRLSINYQSLKTNRSIEVRKGKATHLALPFGFQLFTDDALWYSKIQKSLFKFLLYFSHSQRKEKKKKPNPVLEG